MDDIAIVNLYWERSENAISETAAKYGNYCRTISYNILASAEDAEECVNDTYWKAWNSMPDHRPSHFDEPIGSAGNMPQGGLCKPPARPVVMIHLYAENTHFYVMIKTL